MADPDDAAEESDRALRERVEQRYDFEDFGPSDMAEMSLEEWEAVFDPDTWITGQRLLDRVAADLKRRVNRREVFAVVEREADRVVAYSDVDYVVVHPNGDVEGEGALLREVEPIVALCSMEDYDVPDAPSGQLLPDPSDVADGTGNLGNLLLQVIAGIQMLAGAVLILSPVVVDLPGRGAILLSTAIGFVFFVVGVLLFLLVANARLSDRFRAEEYRERLRAVGVGTDERPDFLEADDEESAANGDG